MSQQSDRKSVLTPMNILMGLMSVLIVLVGISIATGQAAAARAQDAMDEAHQAQNDLKVHAAKQNGSFESITSQLSTLRTYHSTLRGEMKEQRKLLDELLRKSSPSS